MGMIVFFEVNSHNCTQECVIKHKNTHLHISLFTSINYSSFWNVCTEQNLSCNKQASKQTKEELLNWTSSSENRICQITNMEAQNLWGWKVLMQTVQASTRSSQLTAAFSELCPVCFSVPSRREAQQSLCEAS